MHFSLATADRKQKKCCRRSCVTRDDIMEDGITYGGKTGIVMNGSPHGVFNNLLLSFRRNRVHALCTVRRITDYHRSTVQRFLFVELRVHSRRMTVVGSLVISRHIILWTQSNRQNIEYTSGENHLFLTVA
jgi:hypothetical protein